MKPISIRPKKRTRERQFDRTVESDWALLGRRTTLHEDFVKLPDLYEKVSRPAFEQRMTDWTGSDGRMRPCLHEKISTWYNRSNPVFGVHFDDTWWFKLDPATAVRWGNLPDPPEVGVVLSESEWAHNDTTALRAMLPTMRSGLSITNSLFELKDFKNIIKAFFKKKGRLKSLLGLDGDSDEGLLQLVKEKPLSSLSKFHLQYNLAYKPLVNDVLTLTDVVKNFEVRLQRLWDRAGQPQTRHLRYVLGEPSLDSVEYGNRVIQANYHASPWFHNVETRQRYFWLKPPTYAATLRFKYEVPGPLSEVYRQQAWRDALGTRLDAQTIWNALPFSFVLDYVVGVNEWLKNFKADELGLTYELHEFCSSVSWIRQVEKYVYSKAIRFSPFATWESHNQPYLARRLERHYDRRAGLPHLYASLQTTGLTQREFGMLSALGIALGTGSKGPRS